MSKEEKPSTIATLDGLSRLILKKDMRGALGIKSGDMVSLTVENGESIILRKYNPLAGILSPLAKESAAALSETIQHPIAICDNTDTIVASAGQDSQPLIGMTVSSELTLQICRGQVDSDSCPALANPEFGQWKSERIVPIVKDDTVLGAILLLHKDDQPQREITASDLTAMQTIATVLAKKID